MKDVQTVIHLVTGENKGSKTDLLKIDIQSTRAISTAAAETGVEGSCISATWMLIGLQRTLH